MTPDDVLVNHSGGGGGWGNPFERDPAAVLADVLNEYVSVDAARDDYGVVIDAASMTVDDAATAILRAAR
jgi:N-methylhydantoinase B